MCGERILSAWCSRFGGRLFRYDDGGGGEDAYAVVVGRPSYRYNDRK